MRQYHLSLAKPASGASAARGHQAPRQRGTCAPRCCCRDNVRNRSRIEQAYLPRHRQRGSTRSSSPTPYFRPTVRCAGPWRLAARRGVRVQLLPQGLRIFHAVPRRAPVYGAPLRAGSRSTSTSPASCTPRWPWWTPTGAALGQVGSSNLDPLSLLLAREANVVVRDKDFASEQPAPALMPCNNGGLVVGRSSS